MLSRLRHRGDSSDAPQAIPAGTGALGTERLRIVDFVGGVQPVTSFDGAWQIAFNGEIYNHAQLRRELESKGVTFRTRCDTEVLANLLAMEGPQATLRLDGMFAFVALHRDGKRWIAARDPVGIKPLYFVRESGSTYFSSEIAPLLHITTSAPVEVFPPGEWHTESAAGRHWAMPVNPPLLANSLHDNAVTLNGLLERAVAKRLPSDLPCAVLFSGGIDSTLILHLARKLNPATKGFYIGNPHGLDYAYAKLYTERLGADVEFIPYDELQVLQCAVPAAVETIETFEPNQIRGGAFSYLLSQRIAQAGYRVALCGEGADELFCGYPELCQPEPNRSLAEQHADILRKRVGYLQQLHRTQLQRVDRCAMRFALEVRVPFLDREILDFALRLPLDQMVNVQENQPWSNKLVLREVYRLYPEIPSEFLRRDKIVFTEGSGMGNNAPRGPFFDHACCQAAALCLDLTNSASVPLRNLEEAWYFHQLNKSHKPERMPFLRERPSVNTR